MQKLAPGVREELREAQREQLREEGAEAVRKQQRQEQREGRERTAVAAVAAAAAMRREFVKALRVALRRKGALRGAAVLRATRPPNGAENSSSICGGSGGSDGGSDVLEEVWGELREPRV